MRTTACVNATEYAVSEYTETHHDGMEMAGASGNNLMVELCKRLYNLRDDMVGKFPLDL